MQDNYLETVIGQGDVISDMLARKFSATHRNNSFTEPLTKGTGGILLHRIPPGYYAVVHSRGGDPRKDDIKDYTKSLVENLVNDARSIGAEPVAFADVIEMAEPSEEIAGIVADTLCEQASIHRIDVPTGEYAVHGNRVGPRPNLTGTMLSIHRKGTRLSSGIHIVDDVRFAVFDPAEKPVIMNSDGVGTWLEFEERKGRFEGGIFNWLAMIMDDAAKVAATARAASGVLEYNGKRGAIPTESIEDLLKSVSKGMGVLGILQPEYVGARIASYMEGVAAHNIAGTLVSTLDEARLKKMPMPKPGDYILAIFGAPNPRSNGITDLRKIMVKLFGVEWHKDSRTTEYMKYLGEHADIFYPLFKRLLDDGIASFVTHMSGGAYNGKFARPITKMGLFGTLDCLNKPDYRQLMFVGANFASPDVAYAKWPMGNPGFITTSTPEAAIREIERSGFYARYAGHVYSKESAIAKGRTGIELIAFNGKRVYADGEKMVMVN